jgi:hypothetical protein
MKEKNLYKIAFMGDKDHGCDIISTLESWGGSNYYTRTGSDPEYVYFINDLGSIDFIHNSEMLSKEMKNFYFMFWHDYNIECQLKVGESINYGGQDYNIDSILFDANNRCIVYKLKSFGIGVEYITNNELTPTEEWQAEEENNEYLTKNNMKTKLAIQGHPTRGNEVIELLKMIGGKNSRNAVGTNNETYYFIDGDVVIDYSILIDEDANYVCFTLEEFLEKYPFKVGDKVIDTEDGCPGIVDEMKWDEDVSDMKYYVRFGFRKNYDFGWYTNDSIKFWKKDENLEETQLKREYNELRMPLDDDDKLATEVTIDGNKITPPENYLIGKITKVDNGMLVEFVKKQPQYPKTYAECCNILNAEETYLGIGGHKGKLLQRFQRLLICLDAYWKIAGEEMGLGKPWKPDWNNGRTFYCIFNSENKMVKSFLCTENKILLFPTEELRDAFYENFKDLIEQCKELL